MPIYGIVLLAVFGGLFYIFMGFFCGTAVFRHIENWCDTTYHEHHPIGVVAALIWPIFMPAFFGWYIGLNHSTERR